MVPSIRHKPTSILSMSSTLSAASKTPRAAPFSFFFSHNRSRFSFQNSSSRKIGQSPGLLSA